MADISEALVASSHGTIISIEVSAGSKSDAFPTSYNPWRRALGCQVSTRPIGGKANIAIIGLIATVLDISRTDVDIVAGASSSQKKIQVKGLTVNEVKSRLEKIFHDQV
jgi:hypothetical protein